MLRAYKQSFLPQAAAEESMKQPIHRFYHTRLTENGKFNDFYSDGIKIRTESIPLASFLRIPVKVNGVIYPSCSEISESAVKNLRRDIAASFPHAFGLGDAHGGNIMISDERGQDNHRTLLYIDYEVAGYHSILMDLAKPFHHDVFFEALYADNIHDTPAIEYHLKDGIISIDFHTVADQLSQQILNIKRRFLIDPIFEFSKTTRYGLEEYIPHLASALFSCACLTRNFRGDWDTFFRNIAIGIVLSQAQDLEGLWACCEMLGFRC